MKSFGEIEIEKEHRSDAPTPADATGHSPGIQAAAAQRLSVTRGRDTSAEEPDNIDFGSDDVESPLVRAAAGNGRGRDVLR